MILVTRGATRTVLLTRRWAVKLPGAWARHPRHWWRHLLLGLLANMQEVEFSTTGWPELCPVRWRVPGGLLVVMPRARVLTRAEFAAFPYEELRRRPTYEVPVECKPDSFGVLDDRVVAVDYGGGGLGGRARRPYLTGAQ